MSVQFLSKINFVEQKTIFEVSVSCIRYTPNFLDIADMNINICSNKDFMQYLHIFVTEEIQTLRRIQIYLETLKISNFISYILLLKGFQQL